MAHFVQITNQVVTDAIVISNDVVGENYPASEAIGQQFIADHNYPGEWLQTSYNNSFRKQYAGIGYTYDEEADVFVAPKPYASWTLDDNNDWQPPIARPEGYCDWNEETQSWVEF